MASAATSPDGVPGASITEIQAEIEARLGFVPPFYEPAFGAPDVLDNLWRQTLSAYLDNPLPPAFKEQLAAYLSRYCAQPYCMVVHSASLRPLGFNGREVLQLIEAPPPDEWTVNEDLGRMAAIDGPMATWPDPASDLWASLLRAAVAIHIGTDGADAARIQLRRLLGSDYAHLAAFLSYIEMCLAWVEVNPEIDFRLDQRSIEHFGPLVVEEPGLERFVADRRRIVAMATPRRRDLLEEIDRRTAIEEQLRLALSAKDEFIGMVSHELRTPLTVLVGQAALLRRHKGMPREVIDGPVEDIARESEHLARIIDNMLTLARLDHRESLDLEPVQLGRLIEGIVTDWMRREPEREFLYVAARAIHVVDADPGAIRQVVDNLISNAVKYSPPGQPIQVSLDTDEALVRVSVGDRGTGIPDHELEAIFQLFHRSSETSHAKGMGIGLTVSQRLVEAHGGTIVARARQGGGTELAFTLPTVDT